MALPVCANLIFWPLLVPVPRPADGRSFVRPLSLVSARVVFFLTTGTARMT